MRRCRRGLCARCWTRRGRGRALAPAGVPAEVVRRLNALLVAPVRERAVAARLEGLGYSLVAGTPEELAALIQRDTARWRGVIERAGIRAE